MTANNSQNETRDNEWEDWVENNGIISYHPKDAKFVKFERKNTQHSLCSGNRNLKGIDFIIKNKNSKKLGLGIKYGCKDEFNDNQYSVGGKVKDRELPLDAAIRECKEEMGLDIPSKYFELICKEQIIDNSMKSIYEKNRYTVYTYFVNGDEAFSDEIYDHFFVFLFIRPSVYIRL
ncbi:NUDIX domain-containing protein [PVC group bacterium]|nr:NUDIX domain-containing protein [PVC group bacterium]